MIAGAEECQNFKDGTGVYAGGKKNEDCSDEFAWAVAGSVVSIVIITAMIILLKFKKDWHSKAAPFVYVFLALWWTCGAGASTFKKPFKHTTNGYFSVWCCFICSTYLAIVNVPVFKKWFTAAKEDVGQQATKHRRAAIVLVASFVELIACSVECNESGANVDCTEEYGYAVIVGVISTFLFLVYLLCEVAHHADCSKNKCGCLGCIDKCSKFFGAFMILWWAAGAGVLTFDKPFKETGNGYFASWVSLVGSIFFTIACITDAPAAANTSAADPKSEVVDC